MSNLKLPLIATLIIPLAGCLVGEGDERCGIDQQLVGNACLCVQGMVFAENGSTCVPCGDNEVVVSGSCVCAEGYARTGDDAPCTENTEEIGIACTPGEDTCPASYPTCLEHGDGYCTRTCESSDECIGDFACEEHDGDHYCVQPPTGQLASCETSEDCAGFDADYCMEISGTCLVADCSASEPCHGEFACCDFTGIGRRAVCVPPQVLTDGECPAGAPRLDEAD